jgi:hypothetical protein
MQTMLYASVTTYWRPPAAVEKTARPEEESWSDVVYNLWMSKKSHFRHHIVLFFVVWKLKNIWNIKSIYENFKKHNQQTEQAGKFKKTST